MWTSLCEGTKCYDGNCTLLPPHYVLFSPCSSWIVPMHMDGAVCQTHNLHTSQDNLLPLALLLAVEHLP